MARPTDKQWEKLRIRMVAGENVSALSREFNVSRTAINKKYGLQKKTVNNVANQIVETSINLGQLPESLQFEAVNLAGELLSISKHIASGSRYGAMTFHRLAGIANEHAQQILDAESCMEKLQTVAALSKAANLASEPAFNLLNANKAIVEKINSQEDKSIIDLLEMIDDD